jgi:uncharacterized integral membrane protein
MQFLKTLFWVLLAVLVALFARANWTTVTINLWNDIQADTKLPLLMLVGFLVGWLPTWLILRARIWGLSRRVEAMERNRLAAINAEHGEAVEAESAA